MPAPALEIGVGRAIARRAELVQQHDDRLAGPRQQLHLGRDVAGCFRRLGGAEQVEQHVGLVAHVLQRLLGGPERAVAPAVPDLADEPADRVLGLAQAPHQPHAVAEARRVPELQPVALRRLQHRVDFGELGHVRRVADLADVAREQGAGERGLAHVGVRDQAQRDGLRRVGHPFIAGVETTGGFGVSVQGGEQRRDGIRRRACLEIDEHRPAAELRAEVGPCGTALQQTIPQSAEAAPERGLVDDQREHRARRQALDQLAGEAAVGLGLRRRREVAQHQHVARGGARRGPRRVVLGAERRRRRDPHDRLRAERLADQRLQAERRLRRRRVRIRHDVDLRGGAALQARQALEIRFVERQREAPAEAAQPGGATGREQPARHDHDQRQRDREQVDPRRRGRADAGVRRAAPAALRTRPRRAARCRTARSPARARSRAPCARSAPPGRCSPSRSGSRARGRADRARRSVRARAQRRRHGAGSARAALRAGRCAPTTASQSGPAERRPPPVPRWPRRRVQPPRATSEASSGRLPSSASAGRAAAANRRHAAAGRAGPAAGAASRRPARRAGTDRRRRSRARRPRAAASAG